MQPLTARDAAEALVAALGLRFGELTLKVSEGRITIVRKGETLHPPDLEAFLVPPAEA